jgi:hypothetical protein
MDMEEAAPPVMTLLRSLTSNQLKRFFQIIFFSINAVNLLDRLNKSLCVSLYNQAQFKKLIR